MDGVRRALYHAAVAALRLRAMDVGENPGKDSAAIRRRAGVRRRFPLSRPMRSAGATALFSDEAAECWTTTP